MTQQIEKEIKKYNFYHKIKVTDNVYTREDDNEHYSHRKIFYLIIGILNIKSIKNNKNYFKIFLISFKSSWVLMSKLNRGLE